MWESLNEGEDPTEDGTGLDGTGGHDPSAAEDARA
jgi:hypothetical protein